MKTIHWLLVLAVCAFVGGLAGCQQISEQAARLTRRPTPITVDTPLPSPTPSPTHTPTVAPTWTPAQPATPLAPGVGTPVGTPAPTATPTPVPLESSCAALWDIYPGGENLISEWLAWTATDPPSLEKHKAKLDALVTAWADYQGRLKNIPVAPETQPIYEALSAAAEKWHLHFTYASNMLATLNLCCGEEAQVLEKEATDLWNQAYDQLVKVCAFCVSMRPSPTPTLTLTPTP